MAVASDIESMGTRCFAAAKSALQLPKRADHLLYLDGWRGICILLVLVGHISPALGRVSNVGVEFFFVLSGRLMAEILIVNRQPLRTFLKRRIARIVPALATYVLIVGLTVNLLVWWSGAPPVIASPIAALFFVHNYLPLDTVSMSFEHTWSLAVEEHAYLLLMLIALLSRRKPQLAASLALCICVLTFANGLWLWIHPQPNAQPFFWRSDVRIASVLLSFSLFILAKGSFGEGLRRLSWLAPVAGFLAILAMVDVSYVDPFRLTLCTLFSAIAVNSLGVERSVFRRLLERPILIWFGTLSFSLYLWQQIFYTLSHFQLSAGAAVFLSIGCALWSFKRVEEPARNYLNSKWGREVARMTDHSAGSHRATASA